MENMAKSLEFDIVRSRPRARAISVYRAPSTDALRDAEYRNPAFQSRASCKAERIPLCAPVCPVLPPPQFPPHMPPLPCQLVPPFSVSQRRRVFSLQPRPPPVHRKRRSCIFRRAARGNFGTLTPDAGFWMVGLDTTRPLT